MKHYTEVTDEAVAEAKSLVGQHITSKRIWNSTASIDAIRHFGPLIGDDNPLWNDPDYGPGTHYGSLIASPGFIFTIHSTAVNHGLVGLQSIYAGVKVNWFKEIRPNDSFHVDVKMLGAMEKTGSTGGRLIFQTAEVEYSNQLNEVIARATTSNVRMGSRGGGAGNSKPPYHYSESELRAIEDAVGQEKRQGAVPKFWEEVRVGEEITPVVKGPLNIGDVVCWLAARGPFPVAFPFETRSRECRPGGEWSSENLVVEPSTGVKVHPAYFHISDALAQSRGWGRAITEGSQRPPWVIHALTNWMGDDGFLESLDLQIRRPIFYGDTSWCKGRVIELRVENQKRLAELEITIENQSHEITSTGKSCVRLPSKDD